MGISLVKAEFLALFLETFVYGVFFILDIFLLAVLASSRDTGRASRTIASIAVLMLLLATAHLAVDFVRAFHAFVPKDSEPILASNISEYYGDLSAPIFTAKTCLYWAQTLLGDGVIVWRCYVVFSRRLFVIVPPVLAMVAAFVSGVLVINTWAKVDPGTSIFVTAPPFVTTFFSVTVFVNVYCTLIIIYRIYTTGSFRDDFRLGMSGMVPVIVVLAESGALYTSGIIAFLCTYIAGSNGQYPALDIITPLIGIVYCLIILQVRFHTSGSRFFTSTFSTPTGPIRHNHRPRSSNSTHISWIHPTDLTSTGMEDSGDLVARGGVGERLEELQWRVPVPMYGHGVDEELGRRSSSGKEFGEGLRIQGMEMEVRSKLGTVWEDPER